MHGPSPVVLPAKHLTRSAGPAPSQRRHAEFTPYTEAEKRPWDGSELLRRQVGTEVSIDAGQEPCIRRESRETRSRFLLNFS